MKTVITGGAGFIGSKLATRLLERGHDVVILDNLSPQIHGEIPNVLLPDGVDFRRCDIRDVDTQAEVIGEADALFHLAAETGTGQSMYEIEKYVGVNEFGTAKLLQVLSTCPRKPRKLILASSRSVYGEGAYADTKGGGLARTKPRSPEQLANAQWESLSQIAGRRIHPIATPESFPFAAGSVYAATKAAQELLMTAASPGLLAVTTVFRFQNVYGEGQSLRNPYTGIISIFFNRARQKLNIPLFEDGLASRDFVHVEDVVRPLAESLDADLANGTTINLGSGVPTAIKELAEKLCIAGSFSVPIEVTGQYRVGDIRHCWADLTLARKHLGYAPQISLSEGLKRFADWAQKEPQYSDDSAKALSELREKGLSS